MDCRFRIADFRYAQHLKKSKIVNLKSKIEIKSKSKFKNKLWLVLPV